MFGRRDLNTTLLQGVTKALADGATNSARQDRHEQECTERYKDITKALDRLAGRIFGLILSVAASVIVGLVIALYNLLRASGKI